MKQKELFSVLLISLFVIGLTACSSDNDHIPPIMLSYENETINFDNDARFVYMRPFEEKSTLYIRGGDGEYMLHNGNPEIIQLEYNEGETQFSFTPLAVGTATVAITDQSNNSYLLTIDVRYFEVTYQTLSHGSFVVGDNVTVGDKKELEEKVKAQSVVEKYKFTFTVKDNSKGKVRLSGQKVGGSQNYVEYEFDNAYKPEEETLTIGDYEVKPLACITLHTESGEVTFYVTPYFMGTPVSRMPNPGGDMVIFNFVRDLTEAYKEEYPAIEKVYEVQTVVHN